VPSLQIRRMRTMALETFKIMNKLSPSCLHSLVHLRNSKYYFGYKNILNIPRVRISRYGKATFKFAAAILWNSLPDHFRTENSFSQFKSKSFYCTVHTAYRCRPGTRWQCLAGFPSASTCIMT
jgi:hypothetical protein